MDFLKAFDSLNHEIIWAVLKSSGVNKKLIIIMKLLHDSAKVAVRNGTEIGDWFHQEISSRQDDPSSPVILSSIWNESCRL